MPKPNDPCICGSGKKYKKCCFHEQSKKKSVTAVGSSGFVTSGPAGAAGAANNPLEGHDLKELLNYCHNEQELDLLMQSMKQKPYDFRDMLYHLASRKCVVTDYLPLMSKDDEHMKLLRKNVPRGMVEHERSFAFEKRYLETYLQAMDKHLLSKNDDSGGSYLLLGKNSACPAVDLAAGAGAFTFEYAKHFNGQSSRTNLNLTWYPTEWENPTGQRNPFTFLRESLHWMLTDISNSRGNDNSNVPTTFALEPTLPQSWQANNNAATLSATDKFINAITTREILFVDATGKAAYTGDKVFLVGLSKVEYNGKHGVLQGKDVKTEGRFAVMLHGSQKAMSFKSTNLLVEVATDNHDDENEKQHHQELLKGLMKRARVLDLQNESTLRNISDLHGRCAVVTCTSLLTQVGYRAPDLWKNVLNCACTLLAPGGILLLHDTIKFGDGAEAFGNAHSMQNHVEFLGQELEECSEPIKDDDDEDYWGRMILMVWRKK